MRLHGTLYEVTNLASFVQNYLTNSSQLGPDSIRPVRDASVSLYQWSKAGSRSRSLAESITDEAGRFDLNVLDLPDTSVFLCVSGQDNLTDRAVADQQRSGCWYRSLPFLPGAIDERQRDLYVARLVLPIESGFSQADLAAALAETKKEVADLEWVKGTITTDGIVLSCGGKGAKASGRLVLNPDPSSDLSKILRHSVEDFHLELPGPSWLVGLVVSRDAIEADIRGGLHDLAGEIDKRLRLSASALFANQVSPTDALSAKRLADESTLSLARLHYTTTSGGGPSKALYTITSEVCLGFPRTLVKKDSRP